MEMTLSDWRAMDKAAQRQLVLDTLHELADVDGFAPSTMQWSEMARERGLPRHPAVCKLLGAQTWRQACAIAGLRYQLNACFLHESANNAMAGVARELEQAKAVKARERTFRGLDVFDTPRKVERITGRTCDGRVVQVVRVVYGVR